MGVGYLLCPDPAVVCNLSVRFYKLLFAAQHRPAAAAAVGGMEIVCGELFLPNETIAERGDNFQGLRGLRRNPTCCSPAVVSLRRTPETIALRLLLG